MRTLSVQIVPQQRIALIQTSSWINTFPQYVSGVNLVTGKTLWTRTFLHRTPRLPISAIAGTQLDRLDMHVKGD